MDDSTNQFQDKEWLRWGEKLFKIRDYTPIPLIIILLFVKKPSVFTACCGTLLIIFGELVRIYSVAFIGSISRTRKESLGGNLITTGPFRYVRNPLYIGNFFIVLGTVVFTNVLWFVFFTILAFAVQYYLIVMYEEDLLLGKFGEEYSAYQASTPAWLPKSLPSIHEIEWPSNLGPALLSEKRTLTGIAILILCMAL